MYKKINLHVVAVCMPLTLTVSEPSDICHHVQARSDVCRELTNCNKGSNWSLAAPDFTTRLNSWNVTITMVSITSKTCDGSNALKNNISFHKLE